MPSLCRFRPGGRPPALSALRWLGFFALALLVLTVPAPTAIAGPGDGKAKLPRKTQITVLVIQAHNNGTRVDPKLQGVQRQLKFLKFSGFRLLDSYPSNLAVGGESTFQIAGGRRLKVNLVGRNEEKARLRLRMFGKKGKLLDTTVAIHRNRAFMVAGPRYKEGKLVISVRVKY